MHFRDLPSQVWYLTVSRPSLPGCMRPTLVVEFKNCQWEDILLTPLWLPWAPVNSYEHIWALRLDWTRCGVLQWFRAKWCKKLLHGLGNIWSLCRSCCMAVCLCFWPMPFIRGILRDADGRRQDLKGGRAHWFAVGVPHSGSRIGFSTIFYNKATPHQVSDILVRLWFDLSIYISCRGDACVPSETLGKMPSSSGPLNVWWIGVVSPSSSGTTRWQMPRQFWEISPRRPVAQGCTGHTWSQNYKLRRIIWTYLDLYSLWRCFL